MSARPGARAPHARLRTTDGRQLSTIDLVTGRWTVLVAGPGHHWTDAVRSARTRTALPIQVYCVHSSAGSFIGSDCIVDDKVPGYWSDLYELQEGGAVLVRPDGHVGARWRLRPADVSGDLLGAFEAILGPAT
ncbi:aromatic-ring hydroxylase C-terminal domain-containing protein [Nocardia sp. CY41]|uniref:aromatic-ring hydroxylase C-terminal domain-containing protein n=1 Tax=Nocardia sp. CY41 TaxID=2608686 RepID=UPI003FA54C7B